MRVIGLTGQPSSGKDTVADYLVSKGFVNVSGGDILREQLRKRGIPTDREHVSAFVAEQREKYGNDYLAKEAADRVRRDTVMSGIRNTGEVAVFRERFGDDFILIAVDAPIETRYRWAQERGRLGDEVSFEDFKAIEDKERASDSGAHEVDAVIALADHLIINDSTKEDLFKKVDDIVER